MSVQDVEDQQANEMETNGSLEQSVIAVGMQLAKPPATLACQRLGTAGNMGLQQLALPQGLQWLLCFAMELNIVLHEPSGFL